MRRGRGEGGSVERIPLFVISRAFIFLIVETAIQNCIEYGSGVAIYDERANAMGA